MTSSWCRSAACSSDLSYKATGKTARLALGGLLVICAAGILPPLARAQDGAFLARFDFGQLLEYDDNPGLDVEKDGGFVTRTQLGFRLERATGVDRFTFDARGDLLFGDTGSSDDGLVDPRVSLGFDRDVRHSRFGLSFDFRETDASSLVPEDDPLLGSDFTSLDSGKRQDFSYRLNTAVGVDAPLGATLDLSHRELRYSGTSDPSLLDENTDIVDAVLLFRIDPRLTAEVFARYDNRDVQGGGVDQRNISYGTTLVADVTPRLTAAVTLSYDKTELSGDRDSTEDGLGFGLDLDQAMTNGTMGLSLRSDVEENGRRNELRFSRGLELPRGGVSISLGLTQTDGLGVDPLYGLEWRQELPQAEFSVALNQSVTTDVFADEQINSLLSFNYTQELTSLSRLEARAAVRNTNVLGSSGQDSQRLDLSLTYRRELERDWDLVGGVAFIRSREDSGPDRDSNRIFIGLDKSLSWN